MLNVLSVLGQLLVPMRMSRVSRDAENLFLRQQLLVLRRSAPARLRLRNTDRLIFVCLYRLFPSLLDAAVIFKPELDKDAPLRRPVQSVGRIMSAPILGGLHHHYARMA